MEVSLEQGPLIWLHIKIWEIAEILISLFLNLSHYYFSGNSHVQPGLRIKG